MTTKLTIPIPIWLDRIFTWPLLLYRLWKYGYTYRKIYLGEGEWAILDQQDYYRLGNFKWYLFGNKSNFYALRNIKAGPWQTKTVSLHREIMEASCGLLVDHRNGNSLDNRRENLRFATHAQNTHNRRKRKNTSSRFIGVSFRKKWSCWCSSIKHNGKYIWLGTFYSEIDAARAYDAAAKKYRGEFARLNFSE